MHGVSVIIPTVRVDHWLDEAVESILSNVGVDLQVIVVHDGVMPDPAKPWMNDARVQLAQHEARRGQTEGMLTGLRLARHDLIARLDADDLASPDRLLIQASYLAEHPETVAVGSRVMRINESSLRDSEIRLPVGADIRHHLLLSNVVSHSSLMMRRDSLARIGSYDASLSQMEDYDVILRLGTLGPIATLDSILTYYRVHSSQLSRGARPFGHHIRRVTEDRRALRSALGTSRIAATAKNLAWRGAQYLRYYRVIRPGHER